MNIYKCTFKEKKGESFWDNKPILVIAADYANAQDKAVNFSNLELVSIVLYGETTNKEGVFTLKER